MVTAILICGVVCVVAMVCVTAICTSVMKGLSNVKVNLKHTIGYADVDVDKSLQIMDKVVDHYLDKTPEIAKKTIDVLNQISEMDD